MLQRLRELKTSSLDISINNAIDVEVQVILSMFGKEQEYQFYLNSEELWKMRSVINHIFGDLSPERVDICNHPLPINDTYKQWNMPDIPQLNRYINNTPYSNAFPNETENFIYTYVDARPFYETPEVRRLAKMYKHYYTEMLQERYVLLREFTRGISKIKRKEYLGNFPKKIPRTVRLLIVSYLGDINGSNCYFAHLNNLMGVIA
jgi:hypothetical protein